MTTYLASLGSNRSLSLEQLSWKLAMLFSLTCPERVSSLTKLDLRHCHILPEGVEFMLSSSGKRGTADQLPKAFFARFPSNSNLCPVEALRCYLKVTRTIRPAIPSSNSDPLFISMWSLTNQFQLHPWRGGFVLFWKPPYSVVISLRHIPCVELQPLQVPIPTSHYLRFWRWLIGRLLPHFRRFTTNLFTAQILHMLFSSETFCNFLLTLHWV